MSDARELALENKVARLEMRLTKYESSASPACSNAQAIEALKLAYRKHHLNDDAIGWDELSNAMCDALCEAMGDDGFQEWLASL